MRGNSKFGISKNFQGFIFRGENCCRFQGVQNPPGSFTQTRETSNSPASEGSSVATCWGFWVGRNRTSPRFQTAGVGWFFVFLNTKLKQQQDVLFFWKNGGLKLKVAFFCCQKKLIVVKRIGLGFLVRVHTFAANM